MPTDEGQAQAEGGAQEGPRPVLSRTVGLHARLPVLVSFPMRINYARLANQLERDAARKAERSCSACGHLRHTADCQALVLPKESKQVQHGRAMGNPYVACGCDQHEHP